MSILVTGATGTVGAHLLERLVGAGVDVRALSRTPDRARFPGGVSSVRGDMLDVDSMRAALTDVSTLFLLNPVTADELTQAMLTLDLAREAGVRSVVYLSVFGADVVSDVPHYAAKYAVERMLEQLDVAATVLRASCFMQNDARLKDALGAGMYPFPIGDAGVSMVDVRDLAELAVSELLRRERSSHPLPRDLVNVVGPDLLTGDSVAAIWSELLGKPVRYTRSPTVVMERQMARHAPSWMAMDIRLMLDHFQSGAMRASARDLETMHARLGRAPRSYRQWAEEQLR